MTARGTARGNDDDEEASQPAGGVACQRLDRWLWHVRLIKTRTLAAELIEAGNVRIGGNRIVKPSYAVKVGDVVTIVLRAGVRVFEVAGFSERRGDAAAAALLYRDLAPPVPRPKPEPEVEGETREKGSGRPTKRDRRMIARLKGM